MNIPMTIGEQGEAQALDASFKNIGISFWSQRDYALDEDMITVFH